MRRSQPPRRSFSRVPSAIAALVPGAGSQRAGGAARHWHGLGHLAPGGEPRCGCDSAVLAEFEDAGATGAGVVIAVRRHQVGYVRTHFIYSDRMR
ncbi:MAG: hypothetical protein LBK54_02090 [Propionibacteriaceae bacterium]|jgi:hypothetical protein|nr:hypothetical protein [Propionibacteriaceae bacterium]